MPLYSLGDVSPVLPEAGRFWIAPDAQVVGNVRLGQDSSIWFAAVLRGDNELIDLGDGSNIQDGVVCHTDIGKPLTIGQNCTIGHKAVLHGCTIGDGSLVGMGATILNNARIGKNSLVGANALVPEGKVFPDNALIIGAPAKAIRALTPEEVEGLARAAAGYVANWKRFARDLRRI